MGKWTNKDTSDHSGDSSSKVSEAAHQARNDAEKSGDFERGNDENHHRDADYSSWQQLKEYWKSPYQATCLVIPPFYDHVFLALILK